MSSGSSVVYNPELSIAEIAKRSGVSEASVRRYIRLNGIDRKYDEQFRLYRSVRAYVNSSLNATPSECARLLNISLNTAKKYMAMTEPPEKVREDKVSVIDTSTNNGVIMTVSNNQNTILSSIMRLYLNNAATFDCDLTVNVGGFYRRGIPMPKYVFDKYPQIPEARPLSEAESLPDCQFMSIVVDLPFMVDKRNTKKDCIMSTLFNSFESIEELHQTYQYMMRLATRLLKRGGILVWKCMDISKFGKQQWISEYSIKCAEDSGLDFIDRFILVANQKLLRSTTIQQHSARKNHSFFLVFRKSQRKR